MAVGLTQTLTEMNTMNISWGLRRPVLRADNLTTFVLKSGSVKLLEPSGPVQGFLYLYMLSDTVLLLFNRAETIKLKWQLIRTNPIWINEMVFVVGLTL
jgi:hypothetical protein